MLIFVTALSIAQAVRGDLKERCLNLTEVQCVKMVAEFRKSNQIH